MEKIFRRRKKSMVGKKKREREIVQKKDIEDIKRIGREKIRMYGNRCKKGLNLKL